MRRIKRSSSKNTQISEKQLMKKQILETFSKHCSLPMLLLLSKKPSVWRLPFAHQDDRRKNKSFLNSRNENLSLFRQKTYGFVKIRKQNRAGYNKREKLIDTRFLYKDAFAIITTTAPVKMH